ncbi:type II toxin-antitoxin system VapC family toxin [Candidatus Woesearchaeota archaeon]|nr:type II toxin-antitoxin system VapC family toxin [Candidatus Woesearchaeota archaeon]
MEREKIVIDASIAVKLFVEEIDTSKAEALIEHHINGDLLIIVPELIFLEVANALRYNKKVNDALSRAVERLFQMQFRVERMNEFIVKKAVEIALHYNITVYDAVYAAIAQLYGISFITADKQLEIIPNVILVEKIK